MGRSTTRSAYESVPAQTASRRLARDRGVGVALSVVCHLAVVAALATAHGARTPPPEPAPVIVAVVEFRPPPPAPPLPSAEPAPATSAPPRTVVKTPPKPTDVEPIPARTAPVAHTGQGLSDAQVAGAASAGDARGGGECDMAARVQAALRKDPLVGAAVAGSAGTARLVWDGDWVQGEGEDGKGLAAVREAVMWEIAFSPAACKAQPVRGLVLLSVKGASGVTRLAIGAGQWRWSDLLGTR